MRAVPIFASLALLLAVPLSTACYPPRIESCRGATSDFSSADDVRLTDVRNDVFFEGGAGGASFDIEAPGLDASCIAVHSELFSDGVLIHTLDSTLTVRVLDGVATSSRFHHYRLGDMVRVTTLGRTLEARVRDGFEPIDAGASDGGPTDAALPFDGGGADAGGSEDAGVEDAAPPDAASDEDAG